MSTYGQVETRQKLIANMLIDAIKKASAIKVNDHFTDVAKVEKLTEFYASFYPDLVASIQRLLMLKDEFEIQVSQAEKSERINYNPVEVDYMELAQFEKEIRLLSLDDILKSFDEIERLNVPKEVWKAESSMPVVVSDKDKIAGQKLLMKVNQARDERISDKTKADRKFITDSLPIWNTSQRIIRESNEGFNKLESSGAFYALLTLFGYPDEAQKATVLV